MLVDLRVRGLGVIDQLTLPLQPGMTAVTGETGAGKTLVVEALQLVLGGRGDSGLVRAGVEEAVVEATFEVGGDGGAVHELVLGRTVLVTGRSRSLVDGRTVPLALLGETGTDLVDICGQHDHQSLLRPDAPRRALDLFAGIDTTPLAEAVAGRADVERRLAALGGDPQQRAREVDMLRFQLSEIDHAAIDDVDEERRLREEEDLLADAGALREAGGRALQLLDGPTTVDAWAQATDVIGGHQAFAPWSARLRAALTEVADVASDLRNAVERWEDDPERLADVQARRRLLADLRRKYGDSLSDVLAFGAEARQRLDDLLTSDRRAEDLVHERTRWEGEIERHEATIRVARQAAAGSLGAAVSERLAVLAMPGAWLEVSVSADRAGEPVRFLLATNPGEPSQPLHRVASGGELARTMLALQLVTRGGAPVMVFDEVDAGVGGEAALALAGALRAVAATHQVLVVTHLAQVAAFADHQVVVEKDVVGERTTTRARLLDDDERVVELSRMLSGHPESETAQAHAAELLALGRAGSPPADGHDRSATSPLALD